MSLGGRKAMERGEGGGGGGEDWAAAAEEEDEQAGRAAKYISLSLKI